MLIVVKVIYCIFVGCIYWYMGVIDMIVLIMFGSWDKFLNVFIEVVVFFIVCGKCIYLFFSLNKVVIIFWMVLIIVDLLILNIGLMLIYELLCVSLYIFMVKIFFGGIYFFNGVFFLDNYGVRILIRVWKVFFFIFSWCWK